MAPVRALLALGLASLSYAAYIDFEGLPDTGLDTSSWVTGKAPPISSLVDLNDMQFAAKNTLSNASYAYYRTAALDEITYQANMLGWSKIRLLTSNLVDVSNANIKTSILGYQFNAPFFIAPAAQAGLASGGAESNLAKAAAAAGILYVPSISSTQSIETIASAKASGQIMFHQEYCWNDKSRLQSELDRMKASGFKAVFLTVDNNGISGIRSRQIRYYGRGGDAGHSDTFTVESLKAVQAMTTLPIIPKGVTDVSMIKQLADLGFPAVYISNHGGRMVDNTPTAVEILLDLHRLHPEVFSKMEIYVDGGVRRATHVLILLALGARAVGLGRPAMFANIYGQQGVSQILSQLRQEILTTMANIGQADINKIRGNTSFINTRQVEYEYFGAPLTVDTHTNPFAFQSPPQVNGPAPSSTGSASLTTSTSKTTSSTQPTTIKTLTGTATYTTAQPTTTSTSLSCPASNNTVYVGPSGNKFLIECGIDHQGGDMSSASVSSFKACVDLCDKTAGCVDVSLSGAACYLKKTLGAAIANSGILGAKRI